MYTIKTHMTKNGKKDGTWLKNMPILKNKMAKELGLAWIKTILALT